MNNEYCCSNLAFVGHKYAEWAWDTEDATDEENTLYFFFGTLLSSIYIYIHTCIYKSWTLQESGECLNLEYRTFSRGLKTKALCRFNFTGSK